MKTLPTIAVALAVAWTGIEGARPAVARGEMKSDAKATAAKDDDRDYQTVSFRGRVVWMGEALKRRFGISLVPEAQERLMALETPGGKLYPIVEDLRGRSFRKDSRLRDMDVELLVRRYKDAPMIQILRVYEWKDDGKYIVDYWCDVCAIVMFEKGPCACCQDPNRLRERRVRNGDGS